MSGSAPAGRHLAVGHRPARRCIGVAATGATKDLTGFPRSDPSGLHLNNPSQNPLTAILALVMLDAPQSVLSRKLNALLAVFAIGNWRFLELAPPTTH
jgi:hypothetical protein